MQRTCTTEERMQSRSSISTQFPIVVVGGHGWGSCTPHLTIFFENPPSIKSNAPLGQPPPPPPPLVNEVPPPSEKQMPPLKHETTFHEMIPLIKHNK